MTTVAAGTPAAVTTAVSFSGLIFSVDVVKKSAYRFLDRFSTEFRIEENEIVCVLTFPKLSSADEIQVAINDAGPTTTITVSYYIRYIGI